MVAEHMGKRLMEGGIGIVVIEAKPTAAGRFGQYRQTLVDRRPVAESPQAKRLLVAQAVIKQEQALIADLMDIVDVDLRQIVMEDVIAHPGKAIAIGLPPNDASRECALKNVGCVRQVLVVGIIAPSVVGIVSTDVCGPVRASTLIPSAPA